jgi:SAM-dependent methyltransferase
VIGSVVPELWDKAAENDHLAAYDGLFERDAADHGFYLRCAAASGAPVVELGSGSGRLVAALAAAGFDVTGVELSASMAELAHRRIAALAPAVQHRIHLIAADMRTWRSAAQTLGLVVMAGDSLSQLALEHDRVAVLGRCREALRPDGMLAMDLSFFGSGPHRDWGDRRGDGTLFYDGCAPDPSSGDGTMVHRFHADALDDRTSTVLRTILCDHVSPSGSVRRVVLWDRHAYIPPDRLTRELQAAGFRTVAVCGGFGLEPRFDPRLAGRGRQVCIARP